MNLGVSWQLTEFSCYIFQIVVQSVATAFALTGITRTCFLELDSPSDRQVCSGDQIVAMDAAARY
jgi:hypothetical protein